MAMDADNGNPMQEYTGIAASPGIVIGPAYIYNNESYWIEEQQIPQDQVEQEKVRFDDTVQQVIRDIKALKYQLETKIGKENASIFDPHIMLLQDPAVVDETHKLIETCRNAEYAFFRTTRKIVKAYKRVEDEYMRERVADIQDILRRVTIALIGKKHLTLASLESPVIVIANTLNPTDTALMHSGKVLAFVTDIGGRTSHATILARALQIPAVIGVKNASAEISPGDQVIVDGTHGKVYVNPDDSIIQEYREEKEHLEILRKSLEELRDLSAETPDGRRIGLLANIEFNEEIDSVLSNGAEGVGLYRSEFQYIVNDAIPSEDELYRHYDEVARRMAPNPVIIRTLDLGGDKLSHLLPTEPEENPYLGWRAIRISLTHIDLFKSQLRAIIRASGRGNMAVMFPMISSMEELDAALAVFEDAKAELLSEGHSIDLDIRVGVMIEIPSAVMIADELAEKVDFFSIGTNDLIQYSVAVDRANDRIAGLFEPFHPGVVRLVKMTVDAAHRHGIPVSVCGEMGGDPMAAMLFLGLGVDQLSMIPSFIPPIKRILRNTRMETAKAVTARVLEAASATEVKRILNEEAEKHHIN